MKFEEINALFGEYRIELEKNGDISIRDMLPGGSGMREALLNARVGTWCETNTDGTTFSPSIGFNLPDGSIKSPDVAWVSAEKMALFTPQQVENEFLAIAPDFMVELRPY